MRLIKSSLFSLALLFSTQAAAVVINFDDINGDIPNGYESLQWDNFSVQAGANNPGSGYEAGIVSAPNVAYNSGGSMATAADGQFSLCTAWLTGAWNDGLEVTVEGWFNDAQVYSQMTVVNTTGPTQVTYNFNGIDELRFSSTGGVDVIEGGSGTHFVLDDMEVVFSADCSGDVLEPEALPVPTLSAWALISLLMALGLVGFTALRRQA